jgi:hypothetical protein
MNGSGKSNYLENHMSIDFLLRGQSYTAPATTYVAVFTTTKGPWESSTAYALNDTISLIGNDTKTHLYKCTTAGTTASAQSTLYPGAPNEVITDGTAVFTEQDSALRAGTACVEPSGGGYARMAVTSSLANWAGTQSAGSTTASTGTTGQTSNNGTITFPTPTANWQFLWGFGIYDASTSGNLLYFAGLAIAKTVNNGDAAPSFAAAALTLTES